MTWITATCPVCATVVPLFHIEAMARGWLRRDLSVTVTGDATDFIAHLWTHQEVKA